MQVNNTVYVIKYIPPCFVKLMMVEGFSLPPNPQPTVTTSTVYGTKGPKQLK